MILYIVRTLIYKDLYIVQPRDSYPECHRFESYLSHYPERKEIKAFRVFLLSSDRYKKAHKKAFMNTVWLSKWLSNSTKKEMGLSPIKDYADHGKVPATRLQPCRRTSSPVRFIPLHSISRFERRFQPFSFRVVPVSGYFVIYLQNHFDVCVSHPLTAGIQFNAVITAHCTEGMAQIIGNHRE